MKLKLFLGLAVLGLVSCSDNGDVVSEGSNGSLNGVFVESEWKPGGELGTASVGAGSYGMDAPAVEEQGLGTRFQNGEKFFKTSYTTNSKPFLGLGPSYSRQACFECHVQYGGHGWRQEGEYKPEYGNGYVFQFFKPGKGDNENCGEQYSGLPYFTHVMAVEPFKPAVVPGAFNIRWETVTSMPSGLSMTFPDGGDSYELTYPVVDVDWANAFNITNPPTSAYQVRVIVSSPLYGLGILDAIPDDSIKAQYISEANGEYANAETFDPTMFTFASKSFPESAFQTCENTKHGNRNILRKFNNDFLSASIQQDGALWDELSILRSDLNTYSFMGGNGWAEKMSQDNDVISKIISGKVTPFWKEGADEATVRQRVKGLLSSDTNLFDNEWYNYTPEISDDDYYSFIVWHRGLAVPKARDLDQVEVQKGKKLFMEYGCASCHRPKWTTGDDDYYYPDILEGKPLPKYAKQTIYPYTDMIEHRLHMKNDLMNEWCRTTPLWGRGLMGTETGHSERMHDCRARNVQEAIMWHCYSKESDAYFAAYKFYCAPKADRDALIRFINSI